MREADNVEQFRVMIEYVKKIYQINKDDFYAKISEKNKRQSERNARRIAREKEELAELQCKIVADKYNVFQWPAKLDIHKLY